MLYSGYSCILWHTREDCILHSVPSDSNTDRCRISIGTSIGPPNENSPHFSQPGKLHFTRKVSRYRASNSHCRASRKIREQSTQQCRDRSVYERSIRFNVCSVSLDATWGLIRGRPFISNITFC